MTKAQPNLQLLHVPPLPSGRGKRTTAQQSRSPFFRLPLELRRLILREAFGGRTIHIDLRPPLATPNLRQFGGREKSWPDWRRLIPGLTAKPDERRWVWAGHYFSHDGPAQTEGRNSWGHHIPTIPSKGMDGGPCCWNGDDARPRRDARRIGVMGFLLSCRRAYGDALFVLYTTNTIALQREGVIDGLLRQTVIPNAPRLTGNGMRLVTSLQVRFPLTLWPSPFYPDDADHAHAAKNRAVLAEQLELLPRAFPNLWNLTWIPSQYVYDCVDYFPPGQLDELEELLLGPLLRFSTTMPPLRKFIVPIPYQLFFTVIVLEQQRPEGRQDFSGQSLGKIRIWYPFTLSPGTLGPDGGGFWLVYGEVYHRKLLYDGTAYGQKLV